MKLDFKSLAFGFSTKTPGSTPAWETALGQGTGYKINNSDTINELVKGLIYKAVPPETISFRGRHGVVNGSDEDSGLVIAAVFDNVYINDIRIDNGKFILFIQRDNAESHMGRLKLKYGRENSYTINGETVSNNDFKKQMQNQLGLAEDACWFVTDISVVNQDQLILKTTIINKDGEEEYDDSNALHAAWDPYYLESAIPPAIIVADAIGSLSVKELGIILNDMYSKAETQTNAIHMFGIKYAPIILSKKYKVSEILKAAGMDDTNYDREINKGINIYKSILKNQYGIRFYNEDDENNNSSKQDADSALKVGENIIFYGVPGCGKSHKIKKEYCNDENFMERVVFHPDYTYSDFVGQILPDNNNGHISYPFVPGPFTRILKKAHNDPDHNYYLIIEELNRGNAPAIFGEAFQLLDRVNGISEYGISNADIAEEVYGNPDVMVKIPSNLFILATMNTADQNVFTLDTAFKRRWRMRSVTSDISKCSFANDKICDSNVTWAVFLDSVNPLIIDYSERNLGSEDKRLGAYFVQHQELQNKEYFSEKVLMYLWNDAFKFEHEKIFDSKYKTLDELLSAFKNIGFKVFASGVNFQSLIDATSNTDINNVTESAESTESSDNEV